MNGRRHGVGWHALSNAKGVAKRQDPAGSGKERRHESYYSRTGSYY
jgi:hypothetical protein